MPRPKNNASTVLITISTTVVVKDLLESMVGDGLQGKNVAEVAERLLTEKLRDLMGESESRANRLRAAHERAMNKEGSTEDSLIMT